MDNIRYKKGINNLDKIDGKAGKMVIDSLRDISPETGQFIIEFAFGDIYERKILNLKQREMITLSSLLTQGDTHNQLIVHINGALNVGLTQNEIIEIFIQCIPYVGFPKVLNAISTAKEVFNSKK
ncbi:carboxymuconolactone decarboxylase family protein [Liquorilactobacillus cacaonum]|uniref:Carboxymuconolactone decarboxylase family protein n=1 Tax=Liquorilactobacillus cacaonum DSM 21116 TaxID=1423729 RepID=A0A0R2CH66_9LACO|nr:carboxymuconolactone decarboxylase family protein [Liquorilactobacillus cacaonum]KRM90952.1 carboxymuconolactone decarboxylase family protein [Liquorilactobacillus cacaonum DSM 21116]